MSRGLGGLGSGPDMTAVFRTLGPAILGCNYHLHRILWCSGAPCDGCHSGLGREGSSDTCDWRRDKARHLCH